MIILDKDHRLSAFYLFQYGLGKAFIDHLVIFPVRLIELGFGVNDMGKGPEGLIGKAIIISVLFGFVHPDSSEGILRVFRRDAEMILLINDFFVRISGAVRHPNPSAGLEHRVQGHDHTRSRHDTLNAVAFSVAVDVWFAVRNYDKEVILQFFGNELLKALLIPHIRYFTIFRALLTGCRLDRKCIISLVKGLINVGNVKQITDADYKSEVLDSKEPVLVDFWAPWCPPCKMLAPVLDKVAEDLSGKIKFVKVNTDENQQNASQLGVSGIPTLIFYKDGKEIERMVGALPQAQLEAKLNSLLSK